MLSGVRVIDTKAKRILGISSWWTGFGTCDQHSSSLERTPSLPLLTSCHVFVSFPLVPFPNF